MTLKGHSNNTSMFLSVSIFRMVQDKHRNFYFGYLPRYGQPPKPIEFEVDQAMLIRLISLMSKLLKGSILTKKLNFGVSQCISGHVISQNVEFI